MTDKEKIIKDLEELKDYALEKLNELKAGLDYTQNELQEMHRDMFNEIIKINNAKKYSREDFANTLDFYQQWLEKIM